MDKKLTAVIVDDEPPARRKLLRLLARDERIEVVAEAQDGKAAIEKIESHSPDLAFLDIEMPQLNGFELLEALGPKRPQIIFITAYDQFAIKAFEVRALDYLLKPFEESRLRAAVDRAIAGRAEQTTFDSRIDDLIAELRVRQPYLRRILLRVEGRIVFIETREIQWVESEEKYVRLHLAGRSYLHRETMNTLETRLDPSLFVRVHRRQIVNMESVQELEAYSHGDFQIVLKSGTRIPLGRTYREKFLATFSEPPSPR